MEVKQKVVEIPLEDVLPNRFQPRIYFNEEAINDLAESIKEHGVIQPIVVRPVGNKYEIIAGERRYKASVLADKKVIPAIISDLNDKDSAEVALIENVQRQNLTPIEEAISYKKILDMGYLNQSTLAEKLGKNQSTIANKLRLLELDDEVQEALLNSKISERHARSLLRIEDNQKQVEMLNRIITERMTVRKTDEEIDKMFNFRNKKNVDSVEPQSTPVIENNSQVENAQGLTFDSLFSNNPVNPVQETVVDPFVYDQSVPEPVEIIEPIPTSVNYNEPVNPGFVDVDKIVSEAQNVNFNQSMPSEISNKILPEINSNESEFQSVNSQQYSQVDASLNQNPIEPVQIEETNSYTPKFFNSFETSNEPLTSQPNGVPAFNFDNLFQNATPYQEPVESQQPIVNQTYEQTNPTTISNETMNFDSYTQPVSSFEQPISSTINFSQPAVQPIYNETSPEVINVQPDVYASAKEAIRECANKLMALGFKQEYDEFDLEDMYQVIFRIEENK
ncbi:MAG: ParB/RepB/Spo0J family partition protein [Clostridium sp.]|nr:ParB/RepB/Spo0J family partition protein [Clostridium sp.]MCM1443760.1 ParB/RepB/Spo0J family partition protein [Candidatus Amulumruptor caecigallinarius]